MTRSPHSILLPVSLFFLSGCGLSAVNATATLQQEGDFRIDSGLISILSSVKIHRQNSGLPMVLLKAKTGESSVREMKGRVYAERLGSTRFHPPLPFATEKGELEWSGQKVAMGKTVSARASIRSVDGTVQVGSSSVSCYVTTVSLDAGDGRHEIKTWFNGISGVLRQEYRQDGALLARLHAVSRKER